MAYYKQLIIKIYDLDNKLTRRFIKKPPNGCIITEEGVHNELHKIAEDLEKQFPMLDYKLVQLKSSSRHKAEFNFCFVGYKADVTEDVESNTDVNNEIESNVVKSES